MSSLETDKDIDDDYYIPLAAQDSKWKGITFKEQQNNNIEHLQGSVEEECVIKLIDLESLSPMTPLLLLFPDLRHEGALEHLTMVSQKSTSSLTKLLCGKRAKLELLRQSKKLKQGTTLETVKETSDIDWKESKASVLESIKIEVTDSDPYLVDDKETESSEPN
ncbi:uncharacterized protein LOC130897742 isoform X2 [Diorhabda carinulata]|uniref:uncharacterized protein LOC130897742 isoform X2 n=1 Tax=Diorhabda carinulata TaxID=1163345 RepID=UPI0025A0691F|nr:uncharacterized protein LOC130897742 isoform X2 [Diorhabda carinulata]